MAALRSTEQQPHSHIESQLQNRKLLIECMTTQLLAQHTGALVLMQCLGHRPQMARWAWILGDDYINRRHVKYRRAGEWRWSKVAVHVEE